MLYPQYMSRNGIVVVMELLFLCTILSACENTTTATISSPAASSTFASPIESEAPSHFTLDRHRRVTAAESFPLAYETAKAWQQSAEWYGVIPFTSIERAFAIPLNNDNPSWFFRFGAQGAEGEYIVEVLNGEVVGTNETRIPGYIEPPLEELEPLGDEWTMMDNVAVLEKYIKEEDSLLTQFPYMLIDYRLAKLKGQPHPVWTLYNAHDLTQPILVMDAITGEILPPE